MPRKTDAVLIRDIMKLTGYSRQQIFWVMEILQGRVNLDTLRSKSNPMDHLVRTLTDEDIAEAAAYAAWQDLKNKLPADWEAALTFEDDEVT
jgi:cytochrome c553